MSRHEVAIEDIWLVREDDAPDSLPRVVVYVKRQGVWYEAIRELLESNFSHCISSYGLLDERSCSPVAWLNTDVKPEERQPEPKQLPNLFTPERIEEAINTPVKYDGPQYPALDPRIQRRSP